MVHGTEEEIMVRLGLHEKSTPQEIGNTKRILENLTRGWLSDRVSTSHSGDPGSIPGVDSPEVGFSWVSLPQLG